MGFIDNFFIFNAACDILDSMKPSVRKKLPEPECSKVPFWLVKIVLVFAALCLIGTFVIAVYFIF